MSIQIAREYGLFGNIDTSGYVKNVIINSGVVAGSTVVGAVSGRNWGTVLNCSNKGCKILLNSSSEEFATCGGIVGANVRSGYMQNCSNYAQVNASKNSTGGIVGINSARIDSSYNYGQISAGIYVGGIAGHQTLLDDSTASGVWTNNSYNYGNISGQYYVGGVIGLVEVGSISKCKNESTAKIESTGNDYTNTNRYWSRTRRNCWIYE